MAHLQLLLPVEGRSFFWFITMPYAIGQLMRVLSVDARTTLSGNRIESKMSDFIEFTHTVGGRSFVRKSSVAALVAAKIGDTVGTNILLVDVPMDPMKQFGSITALEAPPVLMDRFGREGPSS